MATGGNDQDQESGATDAKKGSGHGIVSDQIPEAIAGLKITAIPKVATGIPAIIHSLTNGVSEMGLLRMTRAWLAVNQKTGFDCPSCAWADPDGNRHSFELCENGVKAMADEATVVRVTPEFFARYSISDLSEKSDYWLNRQGRLTCPMILRPGATHYEPISWKDAFEAIGKELNQLESPDEAVFYTSGKATNEAGFLFQLFARLYGTNNLPDCSNMCHESSGWGLRQTLGVGKSTVTLSDLEHADLIFSIGQNPGTNHPRMLTSLLAAKRNGATIIDINPLPEVGLLRFKHPQEPMHLLGAGTRISDGLLQVRINGDVALLKGIIKAVLEAEDRSPGTVLDRDFIDSHTSGFEEFRQHVKTTDWRQIEEQSGIAKERILEIGEMAARARGTIICWTMGLTQHRNGVENVRELVNLLLLRGNIGKPNAGVLCVRGHSNVQGLRTMGIWEQMDEGFLNRLRDEFKFEPPRRKGYDTVETIRAMDAGKLKAFISLGGNFLSATPDTDVVARGLRKCSLTAFISTKLNRNHLVTGQTSVILPCIGRTEVDVQASGPQFETVEDTLGVVSSSRGVLTPVFEHLKSEVAIIAGVAAATVSGKGDVHWMNFLDYDEIRDRASRVVAGFENFNERVRAPGGFYAPVPAKQRRFATATGKANFTVNPIRPIELDADQYLMMTIRSHDQFNTTIYGLDDRYRGIHGGRRVIFMNRDDVAKAGLKDRQLVDITSHFQGQRRTIRDFSVIPYDIPRRCTATYYPETNPLVALGSVAEVSNTPASKSVVISIEPARGAQ
ncbi:MAG: FdhF/YdeP family oxidoreductase [Candidatus Binatus sp.]